VADASNLKLHLRMVLELQTLKLPMILVLNMMDQAKERGMDIDSRKLQAALGIPVVEAVAVQSGGTDALLATLDATGWPQLPVHDRIRSLAPIEALDVAATHQRVLAILEHCVTSGDATVAHRFTQRIDHFALHPVYGPVILAALMFLVFQAVFSWAKAPMDVINGSMGHLGDFVKAHMADGMLRGLLVDGVIGGAGSVLVFLPQILILFAFILALEDSGYLPRAAFLLDRVMGGVGLSGRAFIPLLSSFACAIPGIMATRTIGEPRDRWVTILIAPLMTCSLRPSSLTARWRASSTCKGWCCLRSTWRALCRPCWWPLCSNASCTARAHSHCSWPCPITTGHIFATWAWACGSEPASLCNVWAPSSCR